MQPEALAQLREFVTQQMRNGVSEAELRETIKKEGGWTDEDINPVFSVSPPPITTPEPTSVVNVPIHKVYAADAPPVGWSDTQSIVHEVPGMVIPEQKNPTHHRAGLGLSVIVGFIVLLVGGAITSGAYMYMKTGGLGGQAPYTEENILSGILAKIGAVETGKYTIAGTLDTQPRDPDAHPYELKDTPELVEYRAAYARDVERLEHLRSLMNTLESAPLVNPGEEPRWIEEEYVEPARYYPATETDFEAFYMQENQYAPNYYYLDDYYSPPAAEPVAFPRDPRTNAPYAYRTLDGNTTYEITVTFETYDAVRVVQDSYSYYGSATSSSTRVEGKMVTVTPKSGGFYYMSSEPPQPFLLELGESARMLPPEISGAISFGATTNFSDPNAARWDFALDGFGDLGDMTYKFAVDVRKVDDSYYFRIRNMPGIILSWIPVPKETWVHISPSDMDGESNPFGSGGMLRMYAEELPEAEKEYEENREAWASFMRKVVTYAEEEGVLYFKTKPTQETIEEQKLYRYELGIRKDALVPFMTKVIEAANADERIAEYGLFNDTGLLEYLKSDMFGNVFEYIDKNTSFVLHVDKDGNLARAEQSMRLVPPDTATQLTEKQFRLALTLTLTDVNKPLNIEAPESSVPLQEIIEAVDQNMGNSSLGRARSRAELAATKQEIMSALPELLILCDESDDAFRAFSDTRQDGYVAWGVVESMSCGPTGWGTFSITASSIDTTACNGEPLTARVTESGITWIPEQCDEWDDYSSGGTVKSL